MSLDIQCQECSHYHELRKPLRRKRGGSKSLRKGHCLKRSVYASNKPGNPIYPPGAVTEERKYAQHKITVVSEDQIVPGCIYANKRSK